MVPYRLIEFDTLSSTQAYALENLDELPDGAVVWARTQTAGRGRLNRSWRSDVPDNIYASIVLKPSLRSGAPLPLANLTQYLSVVLCQVLDAMGISATIKWPNDVQVGGKKIAGILAELRCAGQTIPSVILGIGVNVNLDSTALDNIGQPATALNQILGRDIDNQVVLHRLLDAFFKGYPGFLDLGFAGLRSAYLQRCSFLGHELSVRQPSGFLRGIATTVNDQGALVLWLDDGSYHQVLAGDTLVCGG